MDTVQNNEFLPPVAVLRIRYSHVCTEDIPFMTEDVFLHTLADVLDTQGPNAVAAAIVCDKNNLALRYRVHEILVGEYGRSAVPERYWRLSVTCDRRLMDKIERLHAFEETEKLTERVTEETVFCERDAVIAEALANHLDDEMLLTIVDAFYKALPASFQTVC